MKKNRFRMFLAPALALLALGFCAHEAAHAQQGRQWVDGKWVSLPEPREGTAGGELALAQKHFDAGKYSKTIKAVKKILKRYPLHGVGEEATLLAGESEMRRGHYMDAFEWFEKQLTGYPSGEFSERALTREYEIADAFLNGRKRRMMKIFRVSAIGDGLDIMLRVAEHAPGSTLAQKAVLRIGDHHYEKGSWPDAVDAYDNFVRLFAKSDQAEYATLRSARATLAQFEGLEHDETPLIDARQRFVLFSEKFGPESALRADVIGVVKQIDETRADKAVNIIRFYMRTNKPQSAAYYCRLVMKDFPDTPAAQKADQILAKLDQSVSGG